MSDRIPRTISYLRLHPTLAATVGATVFAVSTAIFFGIYKLQNDPMIRSEASQPPSITYPKHPHVFKVNYVGENKLPEADEHVELEDVLSGRYTEEEPK